MNKSTRKREEVTAQSEVEKDEAYDSYFLLHTELWFTAHARNLTLKGNGTMREWIYM